MSNELVSTLLEFRDYWNEESYTMEKPGEFLFRHKNSSIMFPDTVGTILEKFLIDVLKIKEENISLFFDGYPSQKELLDRLSENENFKAMIRQLKPWGDNTLLIRVMTLSDSANGVLAEIPLMIVYKEDF